LVEVVALVLCTVPDQQRALAELHRVIRPGGELRFYEHVISESAWEARFQRLAELFGFAAASAIKGEYLPSEEQVTQVRRWLLDCEFAWIECETRSVETEARIPRAARPAQGSRGKNRRGVSPGPFPALCITFAASGPPNSREHGQTASR
jgi:SAM-dependent methyltransferase